MATPARKEVLVVYGNWRRPVNIEVSKDVAEERERLLCAAKELFKDVLVEDHKFYLQTKSEKWGDQLVDLVGPVVDGSVIHLFEESTACKV